MRAQCTYNIQIAFKRIFRRFKRVFLCTFEVIHWRNKKRVTCFKIGKF